MAEEMTETVEQTENIENASSPSSIGDLQPKMKITATVKQVELYGAFVDIGIGANAILHISKIGDRVNRVADTLAVGDEIEVWVEKVDPEKGQVTVTMIAPLAVDWSDLKEGQVYTGTVTRLENFGAFVSIGAEKDGLVHISELSHDYVKQASEAVSVGDEVQVKVLGFSRKKRRIDLSRKALLESSQDAAALPVEDIAEDVEEDEEVVLPTAMEIALRRAMDQTGDDQRSQQKTSKATKSKREQQDDILSRTLKLSQETPK
jgi:ribosomal protein S1